MSSPKDHVPNPNAASGEGDPGEDPVMEIRCPTCKATVKVTVSQAEAGMKVKCPKGHEVPLAKAF